MTVNDVIRRLQEIHEKDRNRGTTAIYLQGGSGNIKNIEWIDCSDGIVLDVITDGAYENDWK